MDSQERIVNVQYKFKEGKENILHNFRKLSLMYLFLSEETLCHRKIKLSRMIYLPLSEDTEIHGGM